MSRYKNTAKVFIPLTKGIDTRAHPYALEPPALETCDNAVFAEPGAIGKRRPYSGIDGSSGVNIYPSGTLSSGGTIRKLAVEGDEFLCFTDTEIYSWSEAMTKWVLKGTHLAIKTTERSRLVRTTEQIDSDRAEHSSVVVFTWTDKGDTAYMAALDKDTGAVLVAPTSQGTGASRLRVIALSTKILAFRFTASSGELAIKSMTPSTIATGVAASYTAINTSCAGTYDIAQYDSTNAVIAATDTTASLYRVYKYDEDAALDSSDSHTISNSNNGIAIAVAANSKIVVARVSSTTTVKADLLDSDLTVSATTDVSMGTTSSTIEQVTCAFRSTINGAAYRCYVFWSGDESTSGAGGFKTEYNYLDTGGGNGSETTLVENSGLASHAFDHDGDIYVWVAFNQSTLSGTSFSAIQNTYFLYDYTGVMHTKAAFDDAGGHAQSDGSLPSVINTSGNIFATALNERRIIPIGGGSTEYSARGIREVVFEFDSNDARRTTRIGETTYISGHVLQYDGESAVELGFHIYPWYVFAADNDDTGNVDDGVHAWKCSLSWENAKGELERSTTAAIDEATMGGGGSDALVQVWPSPHTLKQSARTFPSLEVWRTVAAPVDDSPYHLVTSKDPTDTGDNQYIDGDPATSAAIQFRDALSDANLVNRETHPENGGALASLAPPCGSIVTAGADRVYLAGVSYDPLLLVYSKLRNQGEVVAFNDRLKVHLPAHGGDITGLALLNETLIVFKKNAIYALDGEGFDNTGAGTNYVARLIATEVGAKSQEAIALGPMGLLFQSDKGWFLLPGVGQEPKYVGSQIADYDTDTVVDVTVLEGEHMILVSTTSRILAYDYIVDAWSVWSESSLVSACQYDGVHHIATTASIESQDTDHTAVSYSTVVKTAPIKLDGIAGYARVKQITVLGQYMGAHTFGIALWRDYSGSEFQIKNWTVSPTTAGEPLQFVHGPSIQKMEALQIKLTDIELALIGADPESGGSAPGDDTFKLIGIELLISIKGGLLRLPAAQKQ